MSESKTRYRMAIIPALIMWAVSMIFFVIGLSVGDTSGWIGYIAAALAVANTIIQIIGNDGDTDSLGPILTIVWIMSYALGIGSNVTALAYVIINIQNPWLEWLVCISLGTIIEIAPEKLFVLFWRSLPADLFQNLLRSGGSKSRSYGSQSSAPKYKAKHRPDFSQPSALDETENDDPYPYRA